MPEGSLSNDALLDASTDKADILGPSRDFMAPMLAEDDSGAEVVGIDVQCCVIDVSDGALLLLPEYDPVIDPGGDIFPYLSGRPLGIVDVPAFAANVAAWVTEFDGINRLDFYTAREEREEGGVPHKQQPGRLPRKRQPGGLPMQL